jgi:hypothetical protein
VAAAGSTARARLTAAAAASGPQPLGLKKDGRPPIPNQHTFITKDMSNQVVAVGNWKTLKKMLFLIKLQKILLIKI